MYKIIGSVLAISLAVSTGCTVVHTVPLSARTGDTVMVAVGAPDNMTLANTDITYTPTGGSPISIPDTYIRSIFQLYPAKTSEAWLYSDAVFIENNSGHGPYTTVLAIDLPTPASGTILPVGTGSLQVNTTATYAGIIPSVTGKDISLEILTGTGTASSFDFLGIGGITVAGVLSQLEPMKRLEFKPAFTGPDTVNTYGAVEIRIGVDKSGISEDDFNIVVDDKIATTQTHNMSISWNVNRFETMVHFISPTGELQYSDVHFSIISKDLQNQFETGAQNVASDITINSVTWYDVNGNVVTGPAINLVNLTGT